MPGLVAVAMKGGDGAELGKLQRTRSIHKNSIS